MKLKGPTEGVILDTSEDSFNLAQIEVILSRQLGLRIESLWKMFCALAIDSPSESFVGTGWRAGPRTIITARNCVLDRNQMGGLAREIEVTPGHNSELKPFGSFEVPRIFTVCAWTDRQDSDFNIAAHHLVKPMLDEADVFRVGSFTDAELSDYFPNACGCPTLPGVGTELWWVRNRVRATTSRRIFYDVDTTGGQSVYPVYIIQDEASDPIVVGIHAYEIGATPSSIALRVDSAPHLQGGGSDAGLVHSRSGLPGYELNCERCAGRAAPLPMAAFCSAMARAPARHLSSWRAALRPLPRSPSAVTSTRRSDLPYRPPIWCSRVASRKGAWARQRSRETRDRKCSPFQCRKRAVAGRTGEPIPRGAAPDELGGKATA